MAMYTATEKISYLKTWATSGQTLQDYCKNEGIGRTTMNLWAKSILADDYTSTLRDPEQKQILLKKLKKMESSSNTSESVKSQTPALVMVNKSIQKKHKTAPISIEYMGAKISIDENSVESVFRALKAVNG